MTEIVNRVKESGLITIDLADYKNTLSLCQIDVSEQLWQGLVLKERDFRSWIKEHDWSQYKNQAVYIECSTDAIVPTWAFMLVSSQLNNEGVKHIIGSKLELEKSLFTDDLDVKDFEEYKDGRVIIKGCANLSAPEFMMSEFIKRLQPLAKNIMYGEPCSTVPIFKRK